VELKADESASRRLNGGHHPHRHDPLCRKAPGRDEGLLWVYDSDGAEILAFTSDGIDALLDIINDQIDPAR
jgi:hypothetical protein